MRDWEGEMRRRRRTGQQEKDSSGSCAAFQGRGKKYQNIEFFPRLDLLLFLYSYIPAAIFFNPQGHFNNP